MSTGIERMDAQGWIKREQILCTTRFWARLEGLAKGMLTDREREREGGRGRWREREAAKGEREGASERWKRWRRRRGRII